ncbi:MULTISPECIES: GmrSD restriction endonuclease domain-containing protein [unclassified Arsukibacterium]|uniref:GmrSD restriction endonuclease domain-containing protein n=1 Tax=unclassified Arsukibacterium TaxID=2635278 RepID=UPI000C408BB6|nr:MULTISPECIES: DUF262 domain-containing protein [unclassified Arsukibacterium]MAA95886.1 hypothetical protein [Rheinheimera sp.]MBM32723.1 hypothetical protein [Rheinheimera sp.]HAW91381.1 hypothetical protein [Candidatus Azambacteria bacterium]|tara:strand:+ start:56108 stop:57700 length:1593 start_codon:yes stop_codon:yes gene_type:complete
MSLKDPKPEIMRLEELAQQVKLGDIKLPKFQRPFVWRQSDMLNLLDSIYKGYPIGSLLLWNSSQKLISERSILDLEIDTSLSDFYPTNYLLDGQQRLTTLCGALFWNGKEKSSSWNIVFDLLDEKFINGKDLVVDERFFPLNKLINTSDFIKQCMKFESSKSKDRLYRNAERLLKSIKDYKIAVVKIGDMTIEEVAPIFERINSTGRKLTIVDLMMAATWSNGFDLSNEIEKITEVANYLGFDDVDSSIILRSISASAGLGVNKDDIRKLRDKSPEALKVACDDTRKAIDKAVNFLKSEIGVYDFSFVPYGLQFTFLCEMFRLLDNVNLNNIEHIKQWFWFTSVTRYYGTSNTGQITQDLSTVRAFSSGKIERLFESKRIDISQLLFDKFNLRNATSTTFALLLNKENPSKTIFGEELDFSHNKIKNAKFYSSIFESQYEYSKLNISRVINPYSNELSIFEKIDSINWSSHLLPDDSHENLFSSSGESSELLFSKRCEYVASKISVLTSCEVTFNPGTYGVAFDGSEEEI